jgi:hypothetical protein
MNDDDYVGTDMRGKIVVRISGNPRFPSTVRAYYSTNQGRVLRRPRPIFRP